MEKRLFARTAFALLLSALNAAATPGEPVREAGGEVRIPLLRFTELSEAARIPPKAPRSSPADYAAGNATVTVSVKEAEGRASAEIHAGMKIKVLENDWVSVPLLPPGTSVIEASVDGAAVELLSTRRGLEWAARSSGDYDVRLRYAVDAQGSDSGFTAAIPLPLAPSTSLTASLAGSGLDVTLIPSAGSRLTSSGGYTTISAAIPAATGVQLTWRAATKLGYSISRATYHGEVKGESVAWRGDMQVEIFKDEPVTLQVLPDTVTLSDMKADDKPAPILIEGGRFATLVKGRGAHQLTVHFQLPIDREQGPPRVKLPIQAVPVTRVDLVLPGKKEVQLTPPADVSYRHGQTDTVATAFVPMSGEISITWSEAIPEDTKSELRADASIYHAVHAEEGLLAVHAVLDLEISRGETNRIEIGIPKNVDVNRVASESGMIADWRVTKRDEAPADVIEIFFDRQVSEPLRLDLRYDVALDKDQQASGLHVPLLDVRNVRRQRGMIALLASKEIALKPTEEKDITRVGENQLPAEVRERITHAIAHTFKYVDGSPLLAVQTATPERAQGRYDAVVDTLVSLSDVSLKGSASVELNVKSGAISALSLEAPGKVNILNLTAPSLRGYKVGREGEKQVIEVQFTQDMEGQFRAEVSYELIMEDDQADTRIPTIAVRGAEVEQGRIAVEALSAVEVQPAAAVSLSSLDPNELPRQLILKTTNPILLGYKYVKADPPYELRLRITRHKEIETQSAVIDAATYKTLYTKDGLAVTTAKYSVRNTHNQFLRLKLPEGSKVWTVFVGGTAEKPALSESRSDNGETSREVLIKIINSSQGFPVIVTYQTPVARIGSFGSVQGTLPKPDMIVTATRWEVFLPDDVEYLRPRTNMNMVIESQALSRGAIRNEMTEGASSDSPEAGALSVPTAGLKFAFEKLYANQSDEDAYFSIPYGSSAFGLILRLLVAAAAVGLVAAAGRSLGMLKSMSAESARGVALASAAVLATGYYLGTGMQAAALTGVAAALCVLAGAAEKRLRHSAPAPEEEDAINRSAE